MSRILVTGSEGFIGKCLVSFLIEKGHDVTKLDRKLESEGLSLNISKLQVNEFVGDFKFDKVVHLAAQIDVKNSLVNPQQDLLDNILGTLNVLKATIAVGCQNFVYVNSGGAIYGPADDLPIYESRKEMPSSPYGISKLAGEAYVRVLSTLANINWMSLAISNCYGPIKSHRKGVIFEFWNAISNNVSPKIFGSESTRDFIHVLDVVHAIDLALENPSNQRVNISSNIETSILGICNQLIEYSGRNIKPTLLPPIPGEIVRSRLSNQLAKEKLNWSPKIPFNLGLKDAISLESI